MTYKNKKAPDGIQKSAKINISIDVSLHQQAKEWAADHQTTLSGLIAALLEREINGAGSLEDRVAAIEAELSAKKEPYRVCAKGAGNVRTVLQGDGSIQKKPSKKLRIFQISPIDPKSDVWEGERHKAALVRAEEESDAIRYPRVKFAKNIPSPWKNPSLVEIKDLGIDNSPGTSPGFIRWEEKGPANEIHQEGVAKTRPPKS